MSLKKQLAAGSISRVASFIVDAICAIIIVPIIIKFIGDRLYGLWVIVASLTGYYFLIDLGFNQAVTRFIAKAIGEKKEEKAGVYLTNSFIVLSAISGLFSVLVAIVLFFFNWIFPYDIRSTIIILVALVSLEFVISLPFKSYLGTLNAYMDFHILASLEIVKAFIRTVAFYYFLSKGYGIIALGLINLIVNITFISSIVFASRIRHPQVALDISKYNKLIINELFHFGKHVFISRIGGLLRFRVDFFVIAGFIGLNFVAIYSIASRLVDYFNNLMLRITGVLNPVFYMFEGANDLKSLTDKFIIGTRIGTTISVYIGGNIILFGDYFIYLWVGPHFNDSYPVLVILIFSMTIAMTQSLGISVLQSVNKHKLFTYTNSTEAMANLILSLILVSNFGNVGVALGTAIPMIIIKIFVQPYFVCKNINLSLKNYFYKTAPPLILSSLFFGISYPITHSLLSLSTITWLILGELVAVFAIMYFLFIYIFVANNRERNIVFSLIRCGT